MKKTILLIVVTLCCASHIRAENQTEVSSMKPQKDVSIDIESSGTIIIGNTKFTTDLPQRSKKLSQAVSAYGEETVVDIRPAKYTPMKHVYDVLEAIGGSGCYKFMLEGREYEIPAKCMTAQPLTLPMEVLVEIGPPAKNPATGKAIHAGDVIYGGMVFPPSSDLSTLTQQLRSAKTAAETIQSMLITNILTVDETLYGRVVQVLDTCAEAGIDDIVFSIALEPWDSSASEKSGRKKKPVPRKNFVSEFSKSLLVLPEITGARKRSGK